MKGNCRGKGATGPGRQLQTSTLMALAFLDMIGTRLHEPDAMIKEFPVRGKEEEGKQRRSVDGWSIAGWRALS